jgi:2-polyprenyl-3-methyl-5-hydroxy-6-metoxy-1,4-benzoquinol methylase
MVVKNNKDIDVTDLAGRKTEKEHWDETWSAPVRARVPSRLDVDVRNLTDLLGKHVRFGSRFIEVGCAPGKLLAWVKVKRATEAWGLDYSETGIRNCRNLFEAMKLDIELRKDDLFNSALPKQHFDAVASFGFVEHFDDPTDAVLRHAELLAPGGVAIITIPNYGGIYGRLQANFDPPNLKLHNTDIMNVPALLALAPKDPLYTARAYPWGRMSFAIVNFQKKWPSALTRIFRLATTLLGHLQPVTISVLAPTLVLEIRRRA